MSNRELNRKKRGLLLVSAACLTMCQASVCAKTVSVKGSVTLDTGAVPDIATVTIASPSTWQQVGVEKDGTYAIYDLPPGTYNLFASGGVLGGQWGLFSKEAIEITATVQVPLEIDITLAAPVKSHGKNGQDTRPVAEKR